MQRLMSVKEAAAYTGLSPHTIYTMVSQKRIPFIKVGRLVKFEQAMIDAWLKEHTVMPIPRKVA
jgi:excisionase family DNA binding protein